MRRDYAVHLPTHQHLHSLDSHDDFRSTSVRIAPSAPKYQRQSSELFRYSKQKGCWFLLRAPSLAPRHSVVARNFAYRNLTASAADFAAVVELAEERLVPTAGNCKDP